MGGSKAVKGEPKKDLSVHDEGADVPEQEALVLPPKCRLTRTTLILADGITEDDWKTIGKSLAVMEGSVMFWIGDWLRAGQLMHYIGSDTYDEAVEATGLARETLQQAAYVAGKIPSRLRNQHLGFHHHKAVAPRKPEVQQKWLERAAREQWTVKELRAAMSGNRKHLTQPPTETLSSLRRGFFGLEPQYRELPEFGGVLNAVDALTAAIRDQSKKGKDVKRTKK